MSSQKILDQLTEILRDTFGDQSISATPEMTADDVPDWDSFGHIRLVLGVENAFGIKFSTAEIAGFENVGELIAFIESKSN